MLPVPRTPEPMPRVSKKAVPEGVVREDIIRVPLANPRLIYFVPRVFGNGNVTVQPMLPRDGVQVLQEPGSVVGENRGMFYMTEQPDVQPAEKKRKEVKSAPAPKKRKAAHVFTAPRRSPLAPVFNYCFDGSMSINDVVFHPYEFFIFVDVNGIQHLVLIRGTCRIPGEFHESRPLVWTRVIFPHSPGVYCRINEDIDLEIRMGSGRFHRVDSLSNFKPREAWWLPGGVNIPPVMHHHQEGESLTFPKIQRYFRAGDLVTLSGSFAMFYVKHVYSYNGIKYFFVVSVAPGNPVFPRPVMRVVLNDELEGPLIQWKQIPDLWWKFNYDPSTEESLVYERLRAGPVRGTIVSVPTDAGDMEIARVVRSWTDPLGCQFFKVQYPIVNPYDLIREFKDFSGDVVQGPHFRWSLEHRWPKITPDTPSVAKRPQLPPLVIPPPIELGDPVIESLPSIAEIAPAVFVNQEPPAMEDQDFGGLPFFPGHEFLESHHGL